VCPEVYPQPSKISVSECFDHTLYDGSWFTRKSDGSKQVSLNTLKRRIITYSIHQNFRTAFFVRTM
jgi:hypothetical protein